MPSLKRNSMKYKLAWYVMQLWQTGNVGARNICAVEGQPEGGFKDYNTALAWMVDNYKKEYYPNSFATFTIMEIITPLNP